MRIAYDHEIFSSQLYGGISRYFYNLATHLSARSQIDLGIIAPLYINSYLKSPNFLNIKGFPTPAIPKAKRIASEISSLFSPLSMNLYRPDIVHETGYLRRSSAPKRAAHVVTVHDMIHEIYPSLFEESEARQATRAKRAAIDRADLVICVSENTRRDLINLFGISKEKTVTVYHGYDLAGNKFEPMDYTDREMPQAHRQRQAYLLYVGARRGYKNFVNLLKAYANSPWLISNFNLVCFGGGQFTAAETKLISGLGLSPAQVRQVGGDDDALAKAYRGAAAFVYPSLYEGFGIPPLEAMSLDCPVICSNTSSIPEVVGSAGEYFAPEVPEDIAAAIERVLSSTTRRQALVELGRQRHVQFSWKKCAQETLDVYRQVA